MPKITIAKELPQGFHWFNEPKEYHVNDDGSIVFSTNPDTDFWQRTHYGFRRDNGHCLLTTLQEEQQRDCCLQNFSFSARFRFQPKATYDQCGLIVRLDEENWIKVSTEYENELISRLGSVSTNLGYSDWATTDISSSIQTMWYRINKRGNDFLLENSTDGQTWSQMRITHLHKEIQPNTLKFGIYACSPKDSSFECIVDEICQEKNCWELEK